MLLHGSQIWRTDHRLDADALMVLFVTENFDKMMSMKIYNQLYLHVLDWKVSYLHIISLILKLQDNK